jgi:hypothetical protein
VALKHYLNFAETGYLNTADPPEVEADYAFIEEVAEALGREGYEVATKVGSAVFRIDLAVRDKERPGRYVMGIQCDGPTYHRARSARDRDRLRQVVLERMGWQIHSVWSTDWFRNPTQELQRILTALETAEAKVAGEQRPPNPPAKPIAAAAELIERHDNDSYPAAVQARPYEVARLQIRTQRELHELPRSQVVGWIEQVVGVESPIHRDEVIRRIADAAGRRMGSRIKATLEEAITHAVRIRAIHKRGDFLWNREMKVQVRSHANTPEYSRRMEQIAPEEVMLAVQTAVQNGLGMRREEIPAAVCSRLGFGRTSEEMRRHIDDLIGQMIGRGQLIKRGDSLVAG